MPTVSAGNNMCLCNPLWRGDRGGQVSKTVSEPDACVSAEGESRKRAHGVRDAVFAFWPLR